MVGKMGPLGQAISSLFLQEFVSAFFLSMRSFFAPKKTLNYPFHNVFLELGFARGKGKAHLT
jgi:hypothetical protein